MVSFLLIAVLIIIGILVLQWIISKLPPNIQNLIGDFLRESFK